MSFLAAFGFWENDDYWMPQQLNPEILKLKIEYELKFSWIDQIATYYRMIDWWNRLLLHVGICLIGFGWGFLTMSTIPILVLGGSYMLSTMLLHWHAESLAKRFLQLTENIQYQQERLNAQIYESGHLIVQLEEQIELQASKTNALQEEALKASNDLKKIRKFCEEIETDFQSLSVELKHYREVIMQRIESAQKIFSRTEPAARCLI